MNIERFCTELTGLHANPTAAKKITLLILATWLLMFGLAFLFISSVDSLGQLFVNTQNENLRQLPYEYEDFGRYKDIPPP